jgi:hypothetical protein
METTQPDLASWYPFHTSHWPRGIISPDEYDGGQRLQLSWDLGSVTGKEKKQIIKEWCAKLPTMTNLRWLSMWSHVTQPLFDAACQLKSLECLQIKWSNVHSLNAIRGTPALKYLRIGSSTKIESVEPLAALTQLRLLDLENFKLVTDFSPLLELKALEHLAVTGSMWTRQRLDSLEPFSNMTWLHSLSLDTSAVKSLRPLANLKHLKSLDTGGRLPLAEYAWLAAKLPLTQCRWFSPWIDLASSGVGHCAACGGQSKVMLTGKGAGVLCRICDGAKLEKHVAMFNALKVQAEAG